MDETTKAELEAGRKRTEQHSTERRSIEEREAARRADDPALHKPYLAEQRLDNPTPTEGAPGFVRLENETEEEAEARKSAVLAREEAIMKAREGGTPDERFNPDAAEEERKRQDAQEAYETEQQKLRDEADARIKSQVYATNAQDGDKGITDADREKAEEAKKDEAEAKAGEPSAEAKEADAKASGKKGAAKSDKPKDGGDVLDDLLNS